MAHHALKHGDVIFDAHRHHRPLKLPLGGNKNRQGGGFKGLVHLVKAILKVKNGPKVILDFGQNHVLNVGNWMTIILCHQI